MTLQEKLDVWKKDLMDMSRRNALLYYRPEGKRPSGLAISNPDVEWLYSHVVTQRVPVTNDDLGLPSREEDSGPLKRLERLRTLARDDEKERGVRSVYMVFGLLEWFEADHSETPIYSPLLLVPVIISRDVTGESEYAVCLDEDEEIEVNPTLHEWLLSAFRLQLPTYQDIADIARANTTPSDSHPHSQEPLSRKRQREATPTLGTIFAAVEAAIRATSFTGTARWTVRREACLGRFSFQKLVMRQDLEQHQIQALAHPMLRRLAGEEEALREPTGVVRVDELDTVIQPRDMLEILDADSSQQEAIEAAKAGQSFVLQGPPGTGKSQTIANIIAECLGHGKTVLFVSEKMAALDVVRKRLNAAGLGEFLLDLHDTRRNRRDFVSDLNAAVSGAIDSNWRQPPKDDWRSTSDMLAHRRDQLNAYVRELHLKRFALDISAFQAYGHLARLAHVPAIAFDLPIDARHITAHRFDEMRDALYRLRDYQDVLDTYLTHPWRATTLTSLSSAQSVALEDHLNRLARALTSALAKLRPMAASLGEPDVSLTFGWAHYACDRTRAALDSPLPPAHWFSIEDYERLQATLPRARTEAESYQHAHAIIDEHYTVDVYHLDQPALINELITGNDRAASVLDTVADEMPGDQALRARIAIERRLSTSAELARRMTASSEQVANVLGLPVPAAFDEIETLKQMAAHIAATPMPPRSWLDPDAYAEARIVAIDARDKATWARETRTSLLEVYQPGILEADLQTVHARFQAQYDSFLRYVRPQYYLDIHALRGYLNPTVNRTVDALRDDVARVVRLRETEVWLREHAADLARMLGRHYSGERTDWAQVRAMVDWADSFHSLFTEETTTEAVSKFVGGSASARSPLIAAFEPLATQWSAWESERDWLTAHTRTGSLRVTQPTIIADTLENHLAALRRYWAAVDQVVATRQDDSTPSWGELVETLQRAQAVHEFDMWLATHEEQLQSDLEEDYAGLATNWAHVCDMLEWVEQFMALYPDGVPAPLVEWVARGDKTDAHQQEMTQACEATLAHLAEIETELAYIESAALPRAQLCPDGVNQNETPLSQMRQRVDFLRERLPLLARWVACERLIATARELSLGDLIDECAKVDDAARDLVRILERRVYGLWLDAARADSAVLNEFSGVAQDRIIERFRELDVEHMALAQDRVANLLRTRRLSARLRAQAPATQMNADARTFKRVYDQLVRESQKKRSPAIRQIVLKTGDALREVKPCWMMSPLAVSQFVESAEQIFDLVIFDEASQVLTEDAICAIMRGRQLIVVGDEKQLPPTRFFSKSLADEGDEDDGASEDGAEQERTESILREMLAANVTPRSLKWHYRSQHESLIAFSNTEFYGGQLITFPGPATEHRDGVQFEFVGDGVYDYGGSRTNRREAERVVDVLIRLAVAYPNISLGVVALSGAQQSAIREALANRLDRYPELGVVRETLSEERSDEHSFFIKNLESVQGDERDVMVLSIGYGRDRHGVFHSNFGPLNKKGGERRLNVAVTRARQRMYVVSSIHATDINPTGSLGVRTLRRYLDYAERGPTALRQHATDVADSASVTHFDSPFEQAVYEALTAKGLHLDSQVGCSGYRIDLAVRNPDEPDHYLLGIECDGRSYHSSATARDRDRLRQAHLEGLGWTIHRIWSSDWFTDPKREIGKVQEALERAHERAPLRLRVERTG